MAEFSCALCLLPAEADFAEPEQPCASGKEKQVMGMGWPKTTGLEGLAACRASRLCHLFSWQKSPFLKKRQS